MKEAIVVLLLLHVLGDFYLQRQQDIDDRYDHNKISLKHFAIHVALWLFCVAVFFFNRDLIVLLGLYIGTHLVIDLILYIVQKIQKISKEWMYGLDQAIHLFSIFLGIYLLDVYDLLNLSFISHLSESVWTVLILITGFLYLMKPANYTFKMYFRRYNSTIDSNEIPNAGSHIGSIERMVMFILLMMGAEISLGIILTAKTLTRFEKISKDKSFAQYYLLGTLYSILITLIVYGMIYSWKIGIM